MNNIKHKTYKVVGYITIILAVVSGIGFFLTCEESVLEHRKLNKTFLVLLCVFICPFLNTLYIWINFLLQKRKNGKA